MANRPPTAAYKADELEAFQEKARDESVIIFTSFHKLRDILERHEAQIRKRWAKRSHKQRKSLLLDEWPNMPEDHNPHLKAYLQDQSLQARRDARHQHYGETKFRRAYLWPSVNLEDLVTGNTLLRLINSRGRHLPGVFAQMDAQSTHLGVDSGHLQTSRDYFSYTSYIYEMELARHTDTATNYGTFRRRNYTGNGEDDELANMDLLRVGDGMHVLEIQSHLLNFLVNMCKGILVDINLVDMSNQPIVAEPPALNVSSVDNYHSLEAVARAAPYGVPEQIRTADGLMHVKTLVSAHCDELQDRLWSMREDPAFFSAWVGEFSEHVGERLPGNPKINITDRSSGQRKFWDQMAHGIVFKCYEETMYWRELDRQLDRVIGNLDQENGGRPERRRAECHDAVRKIKAILEAGILPRLRGMLNIYMTCAPSLRQYWCRVEEPDAIAGWGIDARPGAPKRLIRDRLMRLFLHLQVEEVCDVIGWETLSFEFETLLRDKAERPRITMLLAWQFVNLGLLGLLQNQLRICFPRLLERTIIREEWHEVMGPDLKSYLAELEYPMDQMQSISADASTKLPRSKIFLDLDGMGDPTTGKFSYPVHRAWNKAGIEAMQQAERNLDAFWALYDGHMAKVFSKSVVNSIRGLHPKDRTLLRTPDWVEPVAKVAAAMTDAMSGLHVDPFHVDGGATTVSTQPELPAKSKVKTRGTPLAEVEKSEPANTADSAPSRAVFEVDARTYKTFGTLFYKPMPGGHPRDLEWKNLLHAMHAVGFQPTKLQGSAWSFRPCGDRSDVWLGRTITLHEPHPENRLPFWEARRFGRRLTRIYGVAGDSFVLSRG